MGQIQTDPVPEVSRGAKIDFTANLINSQVVPSPSDRAYPLVSAYRAHNPRESYGFVDLEGWLNAVVASEALRRAGPNPTRDGFIRGMESLGGWDPGLGVGLDVSSANHQGLHTVRIT